MRFSSGAKILFLLAAWCGVADAIEPPTYGGNQVAYHDFHDTPFLDSELFHSSLIGGSSNITFLQINEKNNEIRSALESLVHEPFFRVFKLNLYKSCPFWEEDGFCLYRSCAVDTINDWTELPEIWQPEELGKVRSSPDLAEKNKKTLDGILDTNVNECIDEIKDNNYCHLDGALEDCVYVDLVQNPERFTGYGGEQSFQIWKLIYDENCFHEPFSQNALTQEEQCLEKQIFYRLISGMHSSISTHLTNEYLDLATKEYGPNLKQFMFKVGNFPERFENMYLNYILVIKSLIKLYKSSYLDSVSLCAVKFAEEETNLKLQLKNLIEPFLTLGETDDELLFNEKELFQDSDAIDLKNEFKMRFRNVSSIMDCVHCDRCRVWGKVQTIGYGTALKILFELDEHQNTDFSMEKIELIALINTLDRLSKSIQSVLNFEKMFLELYQKESDGVVDEVKESADLPFENPLQPPTDTKDELRISRDSNKDKKKQLQDFSYPKVKVTEPKRKNKSKQTVKDAFWSEMNNVGEALNFIWTSYISLPKTLYGIVSVKLNSYWNKFIGIETSLDMDKDSYIKTLFDKQQTA